MIFKELNEFLKVLWIFLNFMDCSSFNLDFNEFHYMSFKISCFYFFTQGL